MCNAQNWLEKMCSMASLGYLAKKYKNDIILYIYSLVINYYMDMSIKYTPHLWHSHWRKALVSLARSPARARAYSLWNATAEGCRKVMKWKRQPNKESPQWQRKSPIPRFTTLLLVCRSTPLCPRPWVSLWE